MKKNIVFVLVIVLVFLWLWWSENYTKKVMAVHYCFEELADGSLYHYVCEK